MKKAVTVIRELSADERLREQARKRQDALFDEQSALKAERAEVVDSLADMLLKLGVEKTRLMMVFGFFGINNPMPPKMKTITEMKKLIMLSQTMAPRC